MSGPDVALPADDAALEALLRDRRLGPPMPYESTPWDFARNWGDAVLRARVWPVVSRLLVDDDEMVRARAIELVRVWSDSGDLTMPRLLEVAETHPDLYADQTPEGVTLRHEFSFALSNHANADNGPRVAAVLKQMATSEPLGGGAASVIARYEPAFVGARARVWGDAQARWLSDAAGAIAMYRRDSIVPFLRDVSGLGEKAREEILETVERFIQRDDARASSLATGEGLPQPSHPAPSVDDCRRAIGLCRPLEPCQLWSTIRCRAP